MPFEVDASSWGHVAGISELARDAAEFIRWTDKDIALEVVLATKGRAAAAGVKDREATHRVGERVVGIEDIGNAQDRFRVIDDGRSAALAFPVCRRVQQHGAGSHVPQTLPEQRHE